MSRPRPYDAIIVGGSYAGMSAALALGRASRNLLVIDSNNPCNRSTPHAHNFLTQDGRTPAEITDQGRKDLEAYETITFINDFALSGTAIESGFELLSASGETFSGKKLLFATGVRDIMPDIPGFAECWGNSVIDCPYCHGYEVRQQKTGILGNGEHGYEFSKLISSWTHDLTLYTNGRSELTDQQAAKLKKHKIEIIDKEIESFSHVKGQIEYVVFRDGSTAAVKALYTRTPFEQHSTIPEELGCEINDMGYISTDPFQHATVPGIFACGDNTSFLRSISMAVATGTTAGAMLNRELIGTDF